VATHTDPPDGTWAHWEAPYADTDDPGAIPPPRFGADPLSGPSLDFRPLFLLVDAVRRGLPREVREILMTLRALIDWYLDRLERRPAEPSVEDIPID
jgi:hypothetical protein